MITFKWYDSQNFDLSLCWYNENIKFSSNFHRRKFFLENQWVNIYLISINKNGMTNMIPITTVRAELVVVM